MGGSGADHGALEEDHVPADRHVVHEGVQAQEGSRAHRLTHTGGGQQISWLVFSLKYFNL